MEISVRIVSVTTILCSTLETVKLDRSADISIGGCAAIRSMPLVSYLVVGHKTVLPMVTTPDPAAERGRHASKEHLMAVCHNRYLSFTKHFLHPRPTIGRFAPLIETCLPRKRGQESKATPADRQINGQVSGQNHLARCST